MEHEIESEPTTAADGGCPECGSARVRFRVQHTGVSHRPLQERSLAWECRQCAARWTERLFGVPHAARPAPPAA